VEDELLIRWAIADYLQECGYKTLAASNAEEAIAAIQGYQGSIDIVFSDIGCPGPWTDSGLQHG